MFVTVASDSVVLFPFIPGQCKVCLCSSWPHYGSKVPFILLRWTGSGFRRDRGTAQHLVLTGQKTSFTAAATSLPNNQHYHHCNMILLEVSFDDLHPSVFLCFLQDASVLQTVTGLGSTVSTTWIPNLGVAACFGRSKVICNFSLQP